MFARRMSRWAAAAVVALGIAEISAHAQQPGANDLLSEARARQKIADQKAELEVQQAIADADRLGRTNPARAVQLLQAMQTNVDLSAAISPEARKSLTGVIQVKVAALKGGALPANPGVKLDPNAPGVRSANKAEFDKIVAEVNEVRAGIDTIEKLQAAGRTLEANTAIRDLTAKYPNNPAVIALASNDATANQVADARLFSTEQSYRINEAFKSVDRSSLPPIGDVEFPKDWKEKTAKRRKQDQIQLSEKEKKIVTALDSPITADFNNRPLEEALQDLSNELNLPLAIDTKSISDLGVDLKKPFSFQARGISARTVLRQALASQGLTFVVKDEIIQVVTVERARDMLVTRVYYLGDLTQGVGPLSGNPLRWGPYADFQQTTANVKLITDAIESSVDPLCWKQAGGPCTITYNPASNSIIVRAPAEVHATLGGKFSGGR